MSKRKGNDVLTGNAPEGSMAQGWQGERKDVLRDEFGLEIPVENVPYDAIMIAVFDCSVIARLSSLFNASTSPLTKNTFLSL